jgi:hypothetical protein
VSVSLNRIRIAPACVNGAASTALDWATAGLIRGNQVEQYIMKRAHIPRWQMSRSGSSVRVLNLVED